MWPWTASLTVSYTHLDVYKRQIITSTYNAGAVAQSGLFNNASQHWNHALFWEVMGPGEKKMPGELELALAESFGSVAKFKEDFAAAGAGQFGSGWAWLVKDKDGALKVTKTENGVNPLCFGQTALLGCDVWAVSYTHLEVYKRQPQCMAGTRPSRPTSSRLVCGAGPIAIRVRVRTTNRRCIVRC